MRSTTFARSTTWLARKPLLSTLSVASSVLTLLGYLAPAAAAAATSTFGSGTATVTIDPGEHADATPCENADVGNTDMIDVAGAG